MSNSTIELGTAVVTLKRKLYAMIIGISDYQDSIFLTEKKVRFPKLRGCTSDAKKIKGYLEQEQSFDLHITTLLDEQATKKEIIKTFIAHFSHAGQGDVAILYFSGHGTQEYVEKNIFSSETDGKSEALVCYYDGNTIDEALLADKEMRWLIKNTLPAGCHLLTIFDCCHSEGICRAAVKEAHQEVCEKRIPFVFPQRQWQHYLFSSKISAEDLRQKGEHVVLPEYAAIQMAACESFEPALEVGGEGVFTKCLLKILSFNNGRISYSNLMDQVRLYMKDVYEQNPRLYFTGDNNMLTRTLFLDKEWDFRSNHQSQIVFNEDLGWILNKGELHGLTSVIEKIGVYLKDDIIAEANVKKIALDYTMLQFDKALNRDQVYFAYIPQLCAVTLNVFLQLNDLQLTVQAELYDLLLTSLGHKVKIAGNEQEADYVIRSSGAHLYITLAGDPYRPVSSLTNAKTLRILIEQLDHISAWEFVNRLSEFCPAPVPDRMLEIAYSLNGADYQVYRDGNLAIDFLQKGDKWQNTISVRLTNTTEKTLYVSALLLTSDFASFNCFLNPLVYAMAPGNSVSLNIKGNTVIPLSLEDKCRWYNHIVTNERFNFIVSEEIFDIGSFNINALPPPPTPTLNRSALSVLMDAGSEESVYQCFHIQELPMLFNNPVYGSISEDRLNIMLNDDTLRAFALGLYFNCVKNDSDVSGYILKPKTRISTKNGIEDDALVRERIEERANRTKT